MSNVTHQPPVLPASRTSRAAVAALVIGILSLVTGMFGVLTGIAGAVLGLLALRHIERDSRLRGRKIAIAGLIISGLAVLLALTIYDWNSLARETPERETYLNGPNR